MAQARQIASGVLSRLRLVLGLLLLKLAYTERQPGHFHSELDNT